MDTNIVPNPMSHEEAVKSQAAEQFVLGELNPEDRGRFEAHFFDCKECFESVQHASEILGYANHVLSRELEQGPLARFVHDFWHPQTAVMASLLLVAVGFNIHQQRRIVALQQPAQSQNIYLNAQTRSPKNEKDISAIPGTRLALEVGFMLQDKFKAYQCLIISEHDKSDKYVVPLYLEKGQSSVRATIVLQPGILHQGNYSVFIQGQQNDGSWENVKDGAKDAGGAFHFQGHGS